MIGGVTWGFGVVELKAQALLGFRVFSVSKLEGSGLDLKSRRVWVLGWF